jgi:SAM-dependent methyltransferase
MRVPRYEELPTIAPVGTLERLDEAGYLAANPDVKAAGLDAGEHFLYYGQAEGRLQFVNAEGIQRLRAAKLAALSFRSGINPKPPKDGPMNCLPRSVRESFEIPEFPPVAANEYNPEIVALIRAHPRKLFLDVGAGLRHTYYSNVVNLEIWNAASTDVIAIGEDLPFADGLFDFVFCIAVLEHTKRPWLAAREIIRVTKPGGTIRIDWPFLQPVHGYPHHYFNATPKGTASLFDEACDILSSEVCPSQHPIYSLFWMLQEWRAGLPEEHRAGFDQLTVGDFLGTAPGVHFDLWYCADLSPEARQIVAAGTTLIARKRG